jgi:hypothetical protein
LGAKWATMTLLAISLAGARAQAGPDPRAVAQFDEYIAASEGRVFQEQAWPKSFLKISRAPAEEQSALESRLRGGEVVVRSEGKGPRDVSGGLIHDWWGMVFIPHATVGDVLAVVQDYDHLDRYYGPEVVRSRLLSRKGDDFSVAMRLRKHEVVTVVLDTEYHVHYGRLDAAHYYSDSRSTHVAEIANSGETQEHELAPERDHGFMWRLNSYWRFVQVTDGVFVQCEAISLTGDVPSGLGWLIGPMVHNIPRESLQFTLSATRRAVVERGSLHGQAHAGGGGG